MMEWHLPSNSGFLRSDGVIIHTEVSWWVDGSCGESRDCTVVVDWDMYAHALCGGGGGGLIGVRV